MAITHWVCPTLCGCVIRKTVTFSVSDKAKLFFITEPDTVTETLEIERQCADHAALVGVDALWDELRHFRIQTWTPDTCLAPGEPGEPCQFATWYDDRWSEAERIHAPVDHAVHTRRCKHHEHLTNHEDHYAVVHAENQTRCVAVNAIGAHLDMAPQQVPYRFEVQPNKSRQLVIDHDALGVPQALADEAVVHGATVRNAYEARTAALSKPGANADAVHDEYVAAVESAQANVVVTLSAIQ